MSNSETQEQSNRGMLEQAGIIKSHTVLSQEQIDAINSLSVEDVEHLISARNHLTDAVDDLVLELRGSLQHYTGD